MLLINGEHVNIFIYYIIYLLNKFKLIMYNKNCIYIFLKYILSEFIIKLYPV